MRCLITGGAGFIGSHLADRLIKEGQAVVIVDNLSSGRLANVNPKAKFYKIDIGSQRLAEIFTEERPAVVFHFAAHIEARESVKDPVSDAKTNILGSLNVLENCRKFGVKKIIFASSGGEIYGEAKEIPTSESYLPNPLSPYGVGKLAVEKYLDAYRRLFGLSYLSLRFSNVYGPRQNPDGEAGVVAIFIGKILKKEQPLIHGSGRQTKDYIFIEDVVEACFRAFKKGLEGGVINIGTGRETNVLDIFNRIKKISGSSVRERHTVLPLIGFKRGCLSIEKAKKELNWQPKFNIQDGLGKTFKWFMMR